MDPPKGLGSHIKGGMDTKIQADAAVEATSHRMVRRRRRRISPETPKPEYKKDDSGRTKWGIFPKFIFNKFSTDTRFYHCDLTSCHKPPSGTSWIGVWKREMVSFSDEGPVVCSFGGCETEAAVGAHIRYAGSNVKYASWYIAPACHGCNRHHSQGAKLKPGVRLVKVMQGNVFKENEIFVGKIDEKIRAHLIRDPVVVSEETKSMHVAKQFLKEDVSVWKRPSSSKDTSGVMRRKWPCSRLGGWGWKKS